MLEQIISKVIAHRAGIMLGGAAVGVVATAILAAKDSSKHHMEVEFKVMDLEDDITVPEEDREAIENFEMSVPDAYQKYVSKKERAIIFAKSYWRTGMAMAVTFGLMVLSHHTMVKEIAATSAALGIMTSKYKELDATLKERYPEAHKKIHKIIDERNARKELSNKELIKKETYDGRQRYYDPWSKQIFYATDAQIKEAECTVNESMANMGNASLYSYLQSFPKSSGIKLADWMKKIGWFCGGIEETMYEYNTSFFGLYLKPTISKETIIFDGEKIEVNVINWDNCLDEDPDMNAAERNTFNGDMHDWIAERDKTSHKVKAKRHTKSKVLKPDVTEMLVENREILRENVARKLDKEVKAAFA